MKADTRNWLILAAALVLIFAGSNLTLSNPLTIWDPDNKRTVFGYVYDIATGQNLVGVKVYWSNPITGGIRTKYTDQNGYFTGNMEVPIDQDVVWYFNFMKTGYQTKAKAVTLEKGNYEPLTMAVKMSSSSPPPPPPTTTPKTTTTTTSPSPTPTTTTTTTPPPTTSTITTTSTYLTTSSYLTTTTYVTTSGTSRITTTHVYTGTSVYTSQSVYTTTRTGETTTTEEVAGGPSWINTILFLTLVLIIGWILATRKRKL